MFGVQRIVRSSARLDAAFREVSVRRVAMHIRQYDATLPCDHTSRFTRGRVTFNLVNRLTLTWLVDRPKLTLPCTPPCPNPRAHHHGVQPLVCRHPTPRLGLHRRHQRDPGEVGAPAGVCVCVMVCVLVCVLVCVCVGAGVCTCK